MINNTDKCSAILVESGIKNWVPQKLRFLCYYPTTPCNSLSRGFVVSLMMRIIGNQFRCEFRPTFSLYKCQSMIMEDIKLQQWLHFNFKKTNKKNKVKTGLCVWIQLRVGRLIKKLKH